VSIVPDDDHEAVAVEPTTAPTDQQDTTSSAPPDTATAPAPGTRGRRHQALTRLRGDIPRSVQLGLGALGVLGLLGGWTVLATTMGSESFLLPTPAEAWSAGLDLYRSGDLTADLSASGQRIIIGYGISISIGVVLGVLIGSFRSAAAFVEPQVALLRYIPATALTPLFLLWLGIDEAPKIALIVVGTVFYNVLMVADVARAVPRELINASYTLGAGRLTILRRVLLPHSWPGIIDVARVNLAAAWLMLVVAELLAAQEGLAFRVVRAQRFRQVDTMFALLIVFAAIGLVSDLLLRALRNRTAPWSEGSRWV
jgi:NitT/TauT family transport system permease protein